MKSISIDTKQIAPLRQEVSGLRDEMKKEIQTLSTRVQDNEVNIKDLKQLVHNKSLSLDEQKTKLKAVVKQSNLNKTSSNHTVY